MKFEEALPLLREGATLRRSSQKHISWIRLVDPGEDPSVDGPARVFVVELDGRVLPACGEFEDEKDAKKSLSTLRGELTKQWNQYNELEDAWKLASVEEQESGKLERGMSPLYRKNYFEEAAVKERNASRARRLNQPYLVVMYRDGATTPYSPTGADLLSPDWDRA